MLDGAGVERQLPIGELAVATGSLFVPARSSRPTVRSSSATQPSIAVP